MKEEIVKRALNDFMQYGFKSFTMDDLANKMGMSKKTLYEYFPSKQDLVEATLDHALEMSCKKVETFVQGEGSVIENVYRNQKKVKEFFNINSYRPIWELQKYYPKTYERMEIEFAKSDALFIDKLLEKGWEEELFRKDINVEFYKIFYTNVQRLRSVTNSFPERDFPFWETIYTIMEYFFRILVTEKGLKELERVLQLKKEKINITTFIDEKNHYLGADMPNLYQLGTTKRTTYAKRSYTVCFEKQIRCRKSSLKCAQKRIPDTRSACQRIAQYFSFWRSFL